jgi:ABC-type enterochelin transport system permease subunit
MIKNIPALLGVLAAVASLSLADSAPDMKDMVQNNFVETAQNGVKLSLWESSFSFHFD